jgi:hypothetical protein
VSVTEAPRGIDAEGVITVAIDGLAKAETVNGSQLLVAALLLASPLKTAE